MTTHEQISPADRLAFYRAHATDDEATKRAHHERCLPKTLATLRKHVDYLVNELEELSENSWRKDVQRHPRLPLLMRHNEFVKGIFERVQQQLDDAR
jgi:hypothetical protein